MPRNITVTFADGSTHVYQNAPDDVTPEQVSARASKEFGKNVAALDGGRGPAPALPQPPSQAAMAPGGNAPAAEGPGFLDSLKTFGSDLLRGGLKNLAGLTEGAAAFNYASSGALGPRGGKSAPGRELTEAVEKALPVEVDESTGRTFGRKALEGAGAAISSGGLGLIPMAAGAMSGVGEEGAARLLGDNAVSRVTGALVGGLAGGAAASKLTSVRPQTSTLAREMIEGIDDATLQKAQAFMAKANAGGLPGGVKIDLAQALEAVGAPGGNVTTVRNYLANSKQGNKVQQTLREQPGQLATAADMFAGELPGTNVGRTQAANNLSKAATDLVNQAKKSRSSAVKADYAQAGMLSDEARQQLIKVAQARANAPGATDAIKREAAIFIDKLSGRDGSLAKAVEAARAQLANATTASEKLAAQNALAQANRALATSGAKPIHALDVDTAIAELAGPYKGTPLNPIDPKVSGQIKGLAGELNNVFKASSPAVQQAEAKFAALSEPVNQLKQGPVGMMATPRGYRPDVQATQTKFESLLRQGTDAAASRSEIRALGTQLAKVNPNAFADALKSHVSRQIKSAIEPGADAATAANNADMASKIAQNLWGDSLKYQGLKDAVAVSAQTMGQPPANMVRGLDHLVRLTKAVSSRPATVGGLQQTEILRMGGQSYGADAMRMFGFLPFERTARAVEDRILAKTLSQLDNILTSPEGADLLIKLGRTPIMSKKVWTILGTYSGTQGTLEQPGEQELQQ